MHELGIALSIIEGVEEEMATRPGRAAVVHLRLGPLSGVVRDALLFSYELACEGTALAGSRLEIEEIPVLIYCATCDRERPVVSIQRICCGVCETLSDDIRAGTDLEVFAVEIVDEHAAAAC